MCQKRQLESLMESGRSESDRNSTKRNGEPNAATGRPGIYGKRTKGKQTCFKLLGRGTPKQGPIPRHGNFTKSGKKGGGRGHLGCSISSRKRNRGPGKGRKTKGTFRNAGGEQPRPRKGSTTGLKASQKRMRRGTRALASCIEQMGGGFWEEKKGRARN